MDFSWIAIQRYKITYKILKNKILYKKQPLFLISFCKICRFLREHIYKLRQKGDNLRKTGICLDNLFTLVCITALCLTRERAAASAAGKRKSRHRRLPCRRCLLSVSCNMLVIHALQEGDLLPCKRWPCGMWSVTACHAKGDGLSSVFYG